MPKMMGQAGTKTRTSRRKSPVIHAANAPMFNFNWGEEPKETEEAPPDNYRPEIITDLTQLKPVTGDQDQPDRDDPWAHLDHPSFDDMPDDREEYYNRRAEEMP